MSKATETTLRNRLLPTLYMYRVHCLDSGLWLHSIRCSLDSSNMTVGIDRFSFYTVRTALEWSPMTKRGGKKSIHYPEAPLSQQTGRFSNPPKSNHERKQTSLRKSRFKTLLVSAPEPEISALLCFVMWCARGALQNPDKFRDKSWSKKTKS
jgi:hypothetical protein